MPDASPESGVQFITFPVSLKRPGTSPKTGYARNKFHNSSQMLSCVSNTC